VLPAVVAPRLSLAEFGTYKQYFLVTALALAGLQLGLAQSLLYFVPRAEGSQRRIHAGETQQLLLATGVLAASLVLALTPTLALHWHNPTLAELALPLAITAGALIGSAGLELGLTARGEPARAGRAQLISEGGRVALMLMGLGIGGLTGLAWGAAIAGLVRLWASMRLHPPQRPATMASLRARMAHAMPFGVAAMLLQLQLQLHFWLVGALESPDRFALYAAACLQVPVVGLLYGPVAETLQVRMAARPGSEDRPAANARHAALLREAIAQLATVFLPLTAALAAVAPAALAVLYGPRYAAGAQVMRWSVLSVALASLPLDGVLRAHGRTRLLLRITVGRLLCTAPALAAGWRLGGLEGVAAAQVAVEAGARIVQLSYIARLLERPLRAVLPLSSLLGLGSSSALGLALGGLVCARLGGAANDRPTALIAASAGTIAALLPPALLLVKRPRRGRTTSLALTADRPAPAPSAAPRAR